MNFLLAINERARRAEEIEFDATATEPLLIDYKHTRGTDINYCRQSSHCEVELRRRQSRRNLDKFGSIDRHFILKSR
jgi:hypothetical protein